MFEKIEKFVACACVAVMAVLVFANVVARLCPTRCPPICLC